MATYKENPATGNAPEDLEPHEMRQAVGPKRSILMVVLGIFALIVLMGAAFWVFPIS